MKEHYLKIFRLANVSSDQEQFPDYVLRDGQLFRTAFHPKGWSEHPDYSFNKDGKIYRTAHHEQGSGVDPDYIIGKDHKLYRTGYHPDGNVAASDFEIRD
ncbi:MAG: hypothetical protein ABR534_15685 [Desulfotignum sp.]